MNATIVANVLKDPKTIKNDKNRNMKSMLLKVDLIDFMNRPDSSIRSNADGLGGVLGLFLKNKKVRIVILAPIIAYTSRLWTTWSLKVSPLSSSSMKNTGKMKPIAAPIMTAVTHAVNAVNRSFEPNQVAASFAGAFTKNGWAIPQRTCPRMQIQKPLLISTFMPIPIAFKIVPMNTPVLEPYTSMT